MTKHRLIDLPVRTDERGSLGFAQESEHIPFPVRRIFYLFDLPPGVTRGGHAHHRQHQFLIMLAGGCDVIIDDGRQRTTVRLNEPRVALYVPPILWTELVTFEPHSVCLVLTSAAYDSADYIRDYAEYLRVAVGQISAS